MRSPRIASLGLALAALVSGCERAQPETIASQPTVASRPTAAARLDPPSLRYLANEGVLLSLPEGTVLIDGLFRDGLPEYRPSRGPPGTRSSAGSALSARSTSCSSPTSTATTSTPSRSSGT